MVREWCEQSRARERLPADIWRDAVEAAVELVSGHLQSRSLTTVLAGRLSGGVREASGARREVRAPIL